MDHEGHWTVDVLLVRYVWALGLPFSPYFSPVNDGLG